MGHRDLWLYGLVVDRGPVHCVAARRVAAVGPVENTVLVVELEIDRLRQLIEQHLDVGAVRWAPALGDVYVGAAQTPQSALRRAFLRPVDFTKPRIDGDSDAPTRLIAPVRVAAAGLDQRFNLRAVEVRTHYPHALPVAPIELTAVLIELDLFRRVRDALRDNDPAIPAVEVGPLDRTVVEVGHAHVGPINMTCLRIHDDAVGEMAIGNNGLAIGAVDIHRVNAVAPQFEKE